MNEFVNGLDAKKFTPENIDGNLTKFQQKGDVEGMIQYGKEIVSQANRDMAYTYRLNFHLGEIAVPTGGRRKVPQQKIQIGLLFAATSGARPLLWMGTSNLRLYLINHLPPH